MTQAKIIPKVVGVLVVGALAAGGYHWNANRQVLRGSVKLRPTLEDRRPNGSLYSASTQSFLREHHILDKIEKLEIYSNSNDVSDIEFQLPEKESFRVTNLPLNLLVPRLHYVPKEKPDAFDAFNLMMAEFSRNGLSVPVGKEGDSSAHFESSFAVARPWTVVGPFKFEPNPKFRPVRFSVINNCLKSGLWELSATDRAGEIHHSWFDFPNDYYFELMAKTNGLELEFVKTATAWKSDAVEADLSRLRKPVSDYGKVPAILEADGRLGFSSQGSRRKLSRGFVLVGEEGKKRVPESRHALIKEPVWLVDFIEPGKYSMKKKKKFDLRFLSQPKDATISRVVPLTDYRIQSRAAKSAIARRDPKGEAIEITIPVGDYTLVIGNLPLKLLVPQEDFTLHGFGVGILAASGFAERRALLIDKGPAPSFAYLLKKDGETLKAVNSHELGVEQIFIRTHLKDKCWWEITITSFERIVDLVKYRVEIPKELQSELRETSNRYISPLYFTYRDDNLR